MKKQFTNKARYLGLKLTAIIFALLLFVNGQSWGAVGDLIYTLDLAAQSSAFGTSSTYANKSGTVSSVTWYANAASCQSTSAVWLGTNSAANRTSLTILSSGVNNRGGAIASALGIATTDVGYYAIVASNAISNVGSIKVKAVTTGGTAPATLWCLYTTDGGTTYNILGSVSNPGTTEQTFTPSSTIASAQYAFVFYSSAYGTYRTPYFKFYEGAPSGSSAPTLTADASNNNVDNNIDITFPTNGTWEAAVTAVKIGGTALAAGDYTLSAGNLQLKPSNGNSLLTTSGSKSVTVVATGYSDATVTQVINAGVPTTNSTATINLSLAPNTSRTITCTAKDQYNNLVSGYTFKYDAAITNNDATTAESYTLDGTAITSTVSDINVVATTNASGVATFTAALPATIDGNDGISIQVQLNNGTINIGSAFSFSQLSSQTITFGALSAVTYGDVPFTVSATGGGSGNPVTFTSSDATVATCTGTNGSTITILKNGSCTIYANQAGNASYNAALQVGQTLTVNQKTLTLPDAAAQNKIYTGTNAAVITGTLTGIVGSDAVTLNGTGTFADVNVANGIAVTSTATLSGTDAAKYTLTQPTGLTANITPADQTITFAALANKVEGSAPFNLSATATSGLTVTYTSSDLNVATISGNTVTLVGVGTTTITASQAGDGNYNAAPDVQRTLQVTPAPIVAWNPNGLSTYGPSPWSSTSSNANLTITGLTRGSGIGTSGTAASSAWGGTMNTANISSSTSAITASQFVTFSVSANSNYKFSLSTIDLYYRRSSTGPSVGLLQYAIGNGSYNDISTLTFSNSSSSGASITQIDLSGISSLQSVSSSNAINFRIVLYNNGAVNGSWYVYSSGLAIGGTVESLPTEPTNHATTFTATANSTTAITTTWADNDGAQAASGFLVMMNTSNSFTNPVDAVAQADGVNVKNLAHGVQTIQWTGLTAGTQYFFKIFPYTGSGSSINYKTDGTVPTSNASTNSTTVTVNSTTNWTSLSNVGTGTDVTIPNGVVLTVNANASCNNLTIANGGKLTINDGNTLTPSGTLTIEDGGSLIDNTAAQSALSGKMKRNVVQADWNATDKSGYHLIASPNTNQSISGNWTTGNYDFYAYDEVTNMWLNQKVGANNLTNFTPGRGYLVAYETATAKEFDGVFKNVDVTVNLSKTTSKGEGWNLLGNPYPSNLTWYTGWSLNNVEGVAKVWKESSKAYIDVNAGEVIPANQGFWVKANAAVTGFVIPAAARTHTTQAYNKTSQTEKLSLSVTTTANTTQAVTNIIINDLATYGYDMQFEGSNLYGGTVSPNLYSVLNDGHKLSTNAIPTPTNSTVVNLGFNAYVNGNYTITANSSITNCTAITLEDLKTNTTQNLMQNPVYSFTAATTDNANRFVLHFATAVGVNEIGNSNGGIYAYDNSIYVNANEQIKQISVYNAMGQLVSTLSNVNGLQKINMNGNATGYYIVKVVSDKNVYSEKVLIK